MKPNGWNLLKLDDIAIKIMVGIASAATHAYTDKGVRMLRNLNIKDGWIDNSDILHIDEHYEKQHKNKRLKTGDILTVRTGYPGLSAVVPSIYNNAQCFTSLITRLDTSKALPDYICRFINSEYGKKFISSSEAGGAQKNVNAAILKKMPIPLPTLPEQRKIAKILSTWDKAIATTERLIATSQQQKKALMQQLLTGKKRLVNPDTGTVFEGDWEEVCLSKIAKVSIGLVTTMTKHYVDNGVPLIRNSDIKQNEIRKEKIVYLSENFASESEHRKLKLNDIVTVHTGEVGVSAVIKQDMVGSLGFATLNSRLNLKKVFPEYLCWYFNSDHFTSWCVAMSTGDGRQNLNLKDFVRAVVFLPHLNEQQKIASILTAADKEIELLEAKLAHLKDEKKALMQQLLTGKRRVKIDDIKAA